MAHLPSSAAGCQQNPLHSGQADKQPWTLPLIQRPRPFLYLLGSLLMGKKIFGMTASNHRRGAAPPRCVDEVKDSGCNPKRTAPGNPGRQEHCQAARARGRIEHHCQL